MCQSLSWELGMGERKGTRATPSESDGVVGELGTCTTAAQWGHGLPEGSRGPVASEDAQC